MSPETPKGYRRVETQENVLPTDLYWSAYSEEWLLIGEDRVKHPIANPTGWPNIIRLVAPDVKTEVSGGSNAINVNDLTARDWFAGQALAGLLADSTLEMYEDDFCKYAYSFADAMLKAREEKQ